MGNYLEKVTENIKGNFECKLPAKLNGPEHSVSAVTLSTVKMAEQSFVQIRKNARLTSGEVGNKVNPSSTTTKAVEHFHSLAHRKKCVQSVQEYIQSWPVIVREYVKSLCSWSFQMYSGYKSSYYLKPESSRIQLSDIPMMPKLPNQNLLNKEEIRRVQEICIEHKALPQSSTRTFTSKFKAGTLPLQAYLTDDPEAVEGEAQCDVIVAEGDGEVIVAEGDGEGDTEEYNKTAEFIDEEPEWDSDGSSSDVEESEDEVSEPVSGGFSHVNQSKVTRSGRVVVAAKHFMYDTGLFKS